MSEDCPTTTTRKHDWDASRPLSNSIVTAVTATTGDDPLTIEPLYDAVDPDALERLLRRRAGEAEGGTTITFHYHGCDVSVVDDGMITVRAEDESERE